MIQNVERKNIENVDQKHKLSLKPNIFSPYRHSILNLYPYHLNLTLCVFFFVLHFMLFKYET